MILIVEWVTKVDVFQNYLINGLIKQLKKGRFDGEHKFAILNSIGHVCSCIFLINLAIKTLKDNTAMTNPSNVSGIKAGEFYINLCTIIKPYVTDYHETLGHCIWFALKPLFNEESFHYNTIIRMSVIKKTNVWSQKIYW